MKRKNYTLIELLAAMSIFIVMMGLLFNVFVNASTIVGSQNAKVTILSDANLFFTYLSKDLQNISLSDIPRFEDKDYDPAGAADPIDPDNGDNDSVESGTDPLTVIAASKIAFRSSSEAYDGTTSIPYIGYQLVGKEVLRSMSANAGSYATNSEAIILDGVEELKITVWEDYPGGTELNATSYSVVPRCITVSVTLSTPNPSASAATIEQNLRTVTKTIYIDR
jgi:type II secretory pathway pseudopilin PulG